MTANSTGTITVSGGGTLTVNGTVTINYISIAQPIFSDDQIVQWLRTQWAGSSEGSTLSWSGTVSYSIGGVPNASGSAEAAWKVDMTGLMKARAQLAFELWDDVAAISLVEVPRSYGNGIQFEYASHTEDGNSYTIPWATSGGTNPYGGSAHSLKNAEIWLNSGWPTHDSDADLYFGGYGFLTYLHEIGHALGLSHPGSYNEGSGDALSFDEDAEFQQDTRRYTVMSYFGGYQPSAGQWQRDGELSDWLFSSTPMLYDVLAIQAIYGADKTTRSTDTVYGFNSTAGRDVFDFTKNTRPILTIWDGGGIDTLDVSGFSAQQLIDLNAGTYSNIGGMYQNVAIAFGAVIENAIGGAANDSIKGNSADNRLTGGAGDDIIDGGGGVDSAVFSQAFSQYTLDTLGTSSTIVFGPDGRDTLHNVEKLVFSDRTIIAPNTRLVSISDATIDEGNGGSKVATFTVTRSGGVGEFSVNYATVDISATVADGDYVATSGSLWFNTGVTSRTISVTIAGDNKFEGDEIFSVNLSNPTGPTIITDGEAAGTIANDDVPTGTVVVSDDVTVEGSLLYFTVTRTGGSAPFSVDYALADGTATSADGDYVAASGTLSFDADVYSRVVLVRTLPDYKIEADETLQLNLSNATNGATIDDAQGIGTIYNDDVLPSVAISDVAIAEGNNGSKVATFTVTRIAGYGPFSVSYATADGTATVADGDYVAASGTLAFDAGIDSRTIAVTINGDTKVEADETFKLDLSGATNGATISDGQAIGTIVADEVGVTISSSSTREGDSGSHVATFRVTRTGGNAPFSVNYATADGSATVADGDYVAASGTLSFAAGITERTIAVTVNGDTKVEHDEYFRIDLSNPTNGATIEYGQAQGTIESDETGVAISDVTISEGDNGTKIATFNVTRTGAIVPFSVNYATSNGTAKAANGDYVMTSGTLSFGIGWLQTISVAIAGDTTVEADETFKVTLSNATNGVTISDAQGIGTIVDDDLRAGTVAISDVTIAEGDRGTKVATFTVTRTGGTAAFAVSYATSDGTAKSAAGDYLAASGTLLFGAGVASRTIAVKIAGDTVFESDETFRVTLSDATDGATIGDARAIGTIVNDDTLPGTVTISDVSIAEGDDGTRLATFIVTRTGGTAAFSIDYASADGTAKLADGDYRAVAGTLSFDAGVGSRTIAVKINGDFRVEGDETFRINLSGATNGAKIADDRAIGTIANDDTLPGSVTISDVTIAEGNSGRPVATFTVTRTGGTAPFSVDYATADLMATVSDGDYVATSGTLSFAAGVDSRTISVKIAGDSRFEADETFQVNLTNATNGAVIADAQAIGSITNDDLQPLGGGKILIGTARANLLRGGADSDMLYGLDGDDVLIGGPAAAGSVNQLIGGRGIDAASYAGTAAAVNADLALRQGSVGGVLTDRMDSIESLIGGTGNDTLLGDENANVLTGGAGADRLSGRGGADVFAYSAWSDSNLLAGHDTIDDFVSGTDTIDLTALHAGASQLAFVSLGASTMIQVSPTAGAFDPATGLAVLVNTSAISMTDVRL